MQALTFGRSLARLIRPEDQVQRVLFSDVAGAKEAKEELTQDAIMTKGHLQGCPTGLHVPELFSGNYGYFLCLLKHLQEASPQNP